MGNQHKVRSFYNNILDPHSANNDVTMDTHAVGASLARPLGGSTTAVMHSLNLTPNADKHPPGWKQAPTSKATGNQGIYGLWADAYRELAEELHIEPRVLQSVTWEAKRQLFPEEMDKAVKRQIEDVWQDYHHGDRDLDATQNKVYNIAQDWAAEREKRHDQARRRQSGKVHGEDRNSGDAGALDRLELDARSAQAVDGGARSDAAGGTAGFYQGAADRYGGRGGGAGGGIILRRPGYDQVLAADIPPSMAAGIVGGQFHPEQHPRGEGGKFTKGGGGARHVGEFVKGLGVPKRRISCASAGISRAAPRRHWAHKVRGLAGQVPHLLTHLWKGE
jgi:hypothetical protein